MKKAILIIILLLIFIFGIICGIELAIKNINIDGINEVDNGIITIKIFNQYIDYKYE